MIRPVDLKKGAVILLAVLLGSVFCVTGIGLRQAGLLIPYSTWLAYLGAGIVTAMVGVLYGGMFRSRRYAVVFWVILSLLYAIVISFEFVKWDAALGLLIFLLLAALLLLVAVVGRWQEEQKGEEAPADEDESVDA